MCNPVWCPENLTSPSGEFCDKLTPSDAKFNFLNSQGLKYEAAEVRNCLKKG